MSREYTIIGGGVMGEAIARGLLAGGDIAATAITVCELDAARRTRLSAELGVETTADLAEAVRGAPIVVLAIKPQDIDSAAAALRAPLTADQLVISILAGTRLATLQAALDHQAIVRAMPNTPAQIGRGITVWTATPTVSAEQRAAVERLLGGLGEAIHVPGERSVDMATAVSGSGPGFFFLILEAMIDGAVQIGLRRDLATTLVYQTALGSAAYAQESGLHTAVLREMVTSPGGTTAEGLRAMEQLGVRSGVIEAVVAAYEKAQALGGDA